VAFQNSNNGKAILSQTDRLVGRSSAGGGISEEIPCTAAGRAVLASADVTAQRTALGLGTSATLNTGTGAGNIPVLDGSGKLAATTIPSIALISSQIVADSAARLALVNVEVGDVAKQTDNGIAYILSALPPSTAGNWIAIGDTAIDASEIVSGTVPTARGGTGLGSIGTSLQVLRVNTAGTALEYATPTAGAVRLPYTDVTATSQTLAADNAYGANNASQVIFTLPATAAVGSEIQIVGVGAGGWRIAQAASQVIHYGNLDTTVGTGGRIDSSLRRDTINIKCTVANLEWTVTQNVGNQDVV
jgi:hypothetical protein